VYLVIAAGAVVRMTGSGMGCPDWPKCFGYYIPPTTSAELEWQPQKAYEKGQVIIRNEALWVALEDFQTADSYSDSNWEEYTRHDYAIFNASHTWVEYINRLLGALAGLATLALALFSFRYWKSAKKITLLSWLVVFGMGFQAWLGATVVYSLLEPVKITLHMVMALIIVAFLIYLIHETAKREEAVRFDRLTGNLLWLALGFTLVQVVLGTQVRQFIDEQIDLVGEQAKQLWLTEPQIQFYVHRSFSILVVLLNMFLAYRIYKFKLGLSAINWVLALILVEVITGVAMNYMDFPFGSQPLHLVLASLLFGVQIYLVLQMRKANKTLKTL
ncbi:MAG: COX15/CtaA family protein, partial [Bacteroidota bacterium]